MKGTLLLVKLNSSGRMKKLEKGSIKMVGSDVYKRQELYVIIPGGIIPVRMVIQLELLGLMEIEVLIGDHNLLKLYFYTGLFYFLR